MNNLHQVHSKSKLFDAMGYSIVYKKCVYIDYNDINSVQKPSDRISECL